jgi:prepilin-type N-terminal cleavage/methylation domain-containing protein
MRATPFLMYERRNRMENLLGQRSRAGFTLIEILVSLILLSVLVAAVFPVMTQQLGQADAPRLASDLTSLRSGVETFNVNLRKSFPGDLEDLAFKPASTGDVTVDAQIYSNAERNRWSGPYVDVTLTEKDDANSTGDAFATGFDAKVQYDLICADPSEASAANVDNGSTCASGNVVAVQITGMDTVEFRKVNDLIDGSAESTQADQQDKGKLRCNDGATGAADCTEVYYLAVPFRN